MAYKSVHLLVRGHVIREWHPSVWKMSHDLGGRSEISTESGNVMGARGAQICPNPKDMRVPRCGGPDLADVKHEIIITC